MIAPLLFRKNENRCYRPRSLLQARLPDARVVYCSATGASEPKHMAYMSRLGLWGSGSPFPGGFEEFLEEVGHYFLFKPASGEVALTTLTFT